MSSIKGLILEDVKAALALAAPSRVVTRTLLDFADRPEAELKQGVLTVVTHGQPKVDVHREALDLLIVGQGLVAEDADGAAREEMEFLMQEEVIRFADNLYGCIATINQMRQSAQLDAPYVWISANLILAPFDLRAATGSEPPGSFVYYQLRQLEGTS